MGTFTDQVQRIATEKETARKEKQEKARKKKEQSEIKNRLRNFIERLF